MDNILLVKDTINREYMTRCRTPSDINEHLSTLYEYAKECSVIVECGVRSMVSTWAFLKGLIDSRRDADKKLYCVDIQNVPYIENICKHVEELVQMKFLLHDSATVIVPEETYDLLFIDTWHIYGHLKRELELHHTKVKKYMILHDTEVDKIVGESIRCNWNIEEQMRTSGYTREDITTGLQRAIDEFLVKHGDEWELHKVYTNNNGLTILKRVK
jgi:hypothetical protein